MHITTLFILCVARTRSPTAVTDILTIRADPNIRISFTDTLHVLTVRVWYSQSCHWLWWGAIIAQTWFGSISEFTRDDMNDFLEEFNASTAGEEGHAMQHTFADESMPDVGKYIVK